MAFAIVMLFCSKKPPIKPCTKYITILSKSLKVITDKERIRYLSLYLDLILSIRYCLAVLFSWNRGL